MVREGYYYGVAFGLAAILVGYLLSPWWAIPFVALALFCLNFFRDPDRSAPTGPIAVSPADGKVLGIVSVDGKQRICIFLNVFDVHVNRTPIAGQIVHSEYKTGKFLVASVPEASTENEMHVVQVKDSQGSIVTFKLIAGLIARRINFYKKLGDRLAIGERVALIKFGSRADVEFGPEWKIEVQAGQRVRAGESIIARKVG
jgi:phosphatidylserine decarboxylase